MILRICVLLIASLLLAHPLLAQPPFLHNRWAAKAIASEEYPDALLHGVESLKYWPDNKAGFQAVQQAYPRLFGDYEAKRDRLVQLTDTLVGDETVKQCEELVGLCTSTIKAIEAMKGLSVAQLEAIGFEALDLRPDSTAAAEHLLELQLEAAQMHRDQGERLMERGDRASCRSAYYEFSRALGFDPGNDTLFRRRDAAQVCGTKRVMVLPFSVNASGLALTAMRGKALDFGQQAAANFSRRISSQDLLFIEVVSTDEVIAELNLLGGLSGQPLPQETALQLGQRLGADEIWMGTINSVVAQEPQTATQTGLTHKRTIKVEKTVAVETKNDSPPGKQPASPTKQKTVKVDKTIEATYTEYTQTATTVVQGTYWTIDPNTGTRSEARPYEEQRTYSSKWARRTGGSTKAWESFTDSQENSMPSLNTRFVGGFDMIGTSLMGTLQTDNNHKAVPLIQNKMQLMTPLAE